MRNHHLRPNQKRFFEGWYFKQSNGKDNLAFIPGINIDEYGHKECFIQVITNNQSMNFNYDYSQFYADKDSLYIKAGPSIFSNQGIWMDIDYNGIQIKGELVYNNLTPIKYDIMGPFSAIPSMECNHGVVSMNHAVEGNINFCGQDIEFSGPAAKGYIEKDWGHSFPKEYTWVQCNSFKKNDSIMVSIAHIPVGAFGFTGHIAVAFLDGKEYRFATYNTSRVKKNTQTTIELKKKDLSLFIKLVNKDNKPLKAPSNGAMSRTIHESMCSEAEFVLTKRGRILFRETANNVCFENTYKII